MWFERPKGDAKGSLQAKDYQVQLRDGTNSKKELVLVPLAEKKELKTYVLEGEKNDQDVVDWAKVLKRVLRHEREDDEDPSKLGWLEKKGQKRWFILKEGNLYWFNKEQLWTPDAVVSANGSLDMSECTVADGPEAKQKGNSTNFNFTVKNSRDTYILTAKTEHEKIEWIDVLKDASRFMKRSAKQKRKSAALDKNYSPEKKGFLSKKGQKRYFVLKDSILRWYLDSSEKEERGNLPLLGCTVSFNQDKLEIQIKNKGTHYELSSQSFLEADDWFFMLEMAAERASKVLEGKSLNPRDSIRVERNSLPPERESPHSSRAPRGSMPVDALKGSAAARTTSTDAKSPQQEQQPQKSPAPVEHTSPAEQRTPSEEKKKNSNPFEEEKKSSSSSNPFASEDEQEEEVEEPQEKSFKQHDKRTESPAPSHQTQQTPPQQSRRETTQQQQPPSTSAPAAQPNRELESKIKEITAQKDALERELKNTAAAKEALAQTNKTLEKQKNKLEQEVEQLKARLEKESEEVENLQEKLAAKEKAVRRRWRPDYEVSECTFCKSAFGVFLRRHHCRHCGEIFCADCSAKQAPLSKKNPELVRVCNTCYEVLWKNRFTLVN